MVTIQMVLGKIRMEGRCLCRINGLLHLLNASPEHMSPGKSENGTETGPCAHD
jgi:hypothetical protein